VTHLLKLLLTNPTAWNNLCQEVRQTFNSIDEINSVEVRKLQYMDMVLSEGSKPIVGLIILGMRCGASMPFGLPRLTPPEGAIIAGIPIAGNVNRSAFVLT
jgi:hypothetical protein